MDIINQMANTIFVSIIGIFANYIPLCCVLVFVIAIIMKLRMDKFHLESERTKNIRKESVKYLFIVAGIFFVISILLFVLIYLFSNRIEDVIGVGFVALFVHEIMIGIFILLVVSACIFMIIHNFMPEENNSREIIGTIGKKTFGAVGVLTIIMAVHLVIMFSGYYILAYKVLV